jgi:hypothetical protein
MAKSKKLTLGVIEKADAEFHEQKTIRVLGQYEVRIFTKWRKTRIRDVLSRFFTILRELPGKEQVTEETIAGSVSLLHTLVLSEFTTIPVPPAADMDELIRLSDALIDTGIMEQVFAELPSDQIQVLTDELNKASKQIGELLGEAAVSSHSDGQAALK